MSIRAQVNESSIEVKCEDRISNLPESIISHILSCLPTEDAIRTCVLSKDWEYKWTSIYNIDIDYDRDRDLPYSLRKEKTRSGQTTFVDFVERILLLSQNIKNFHFLCDTDCNLRGRMTTWISTILRRNVESLQLIYSEHWIVLPRSLLNNTSLRKLDLGMPSCIFKVPSANYFPNLISLGLSGVQFQNEFSNTDTLIFTFPVLERFELFYCEWENVKSVEIVAPSLTSLISMTEDDPVEILNYSIKVFGPKLLNFESLGGSPVNFIVAGPPVVKAVLEHSDLDDEDPQLLANYGQQFRGLLKEFSSLEELHLTHWVTKAVANTNEEFAFPMYYKLRKLVLLKVGVNIEGLMELLHSAPSLSILNLGMDDYHNPDDVYDFDAVEYVPSCIVSHLEEVEFRCFSHCISLASFLLKNGAKLKKFRLKVGKFLNNDALRDEITKEVSAVPKASTCVSVLVE